MFLALIGKMMPAEGVYAILVRWKTAAANCVEALRSPPHRCRCRRRSGVAVLKRKAMHCFMSSYLSNKTSGLSSALFFFFFFFFFPLITSAYTSRLVDSFALCFDALCHQQSSLRGAPEQKAVPELLGAIELGGKVNPDYCYPSNQWNTPEYDCYPK